MTDWIRTTHRNARSVQTLVGWIYWDPHTIERLMEEGLPGIPAYVVGRAAPLAPAGDDAVIAAFYSINPAVIRYALALMREHTTPAQVWEIRNQTAVKGLREFVPESVDELAAMSAWLWEAVDACPVAGRVFFGACRSMPRPNDPLLSTWLAVNCLREFRGDTHFAILTAEDVGPVEAGVLHNAWVGYEKDWVPASRGNEPHEIAAAYERLSDRGLVSDGSVNDAGLAFRQEIEDRTDRQTAVAWQAVGADRADDFARIAEPACRTLLARVDTTAGRNFMPASRFHERLVDRQAPDLTS